MMNIEDLKNVRNFLKLLLQKEIKLKDQLTQSLFKYCPLDVAKNIMEKIESGNDPSPVVSAFILWDKNHKANYGTVKWLD